MVLKLVIDLSSYTNQDDFAIRFRNVNQYENNLFIDNINLACASFDLFENFEHRGSEFKKMVRSL